MSATTTALPNMTDLMGWMETLPVSNSWVLPEQAEVPQPVIPGWDVRVIPQGLVFKVVARRGSLVATAEKLTAAQVMAWDPTARFRQAVR